MPRSMPIDFFCLFFLFLLPFMRVPIGLVPNASAVAHGTSLRFQLAPLMCVLWEGRDGGMGCCILLTAPSICELENVGMGRSPPGPPASWPRYLLDAVPFA